MHPKRDLHKMITIGRIATKLRKIDMELQGVYQKGKAKQEISLKQTSETLHTIDRYLPIDFFLVNSLEFHVYFA